MVIQHDRDSPPTHTPAAFRGVFVIMQTPFNEGLAVDAASLRRECDFLVCCRVHGVVWPAAASEAASLS